LPSLDWTFLQLHQQRGILSVNDFSNRKKKYAFFYQIISVISFLDELQPIGIFFCKGKIDLFKTEILHFFFKN
jgi:hypothetical protein